MPPQPITARAAASFILTEANLYAAREFNQIGSANGALELVNRQVLQTGATMQSAVTPVRADSVIPYNVV